MRGLSLGVASAQEPKWSRPPALGTSGQPLGLSSLDCWSPEVS